MRGLSIRTIGLSLSAVIALTYVLCVIWDLVFPGWAMYRIWQGLFPGFSWSILGFLIGLIETGLYSFYAATVFVFAYNGFHRREMAAYPVQV